MLEKRLGDGWFEGPACDYRKCTAVEMLSVSAGSLTLLILFSFAFLPFPSSCRLPLRLAFDVRQCCRHCYSVVSVISPLLLPYLSSGT